MNEQPLLAIAAALDQQRRSRVAEPAEEVQVLKVLARPQRRPIEKLHLCTCVGVCTDMTTCTNTSVCMHMCVHAHVCACSHAAGRKAPHGHTHSRAITHTCVELCACVRACADIHSMHPSVYTHTHTHLQQRCLCMHTQAHLLRISCGGSVAPPHPCSHLY